RPGRPAGGRPCSIFPASQAIRLRRQTTTPLTPKDAPMYKTIVLALLQQHPETHDLLRRNRTLLSAANLWANQLKTSHEAWKERLSRARPSADENQIAGEALEIALAELEDSLTSTFPPKGREPLSLEGAMAFLRARRSSG